MTSLLVLPLQPGVPLAVLLCLAVPLTSLLSRHPLRLVGFGGAMVFSLDSAVLALLVWAGLAVALEDPGRPVDVAVYAAVGVAAWVPWMLGYALAEAFATERRAAVRAYNIGLSALAGALFVVTALFVRAGVAELVTGEDEVLAAGPWTIAAVLAASVVYVGTDLLLSALWVARVEGGRVREALADPAGLVGAGTVLAVNATAVLVAILLTSTPWALVLLAPVAVALVYATRTGTAALTEHARAQALYRAAEGCQTASDRDRVVEEVLAAATAATAAPAALTDTPPGPDQVGAAFDDGGEQRWLVVGPRANRHTFVEGDHTAVATLAALCQQALARLDVMAQIRRVAERDALTGVLNRGAFLAEVARSLTPTSAVLFVDVDEFKAVNDTYGHRRGDQVLITVAGCLVEVVGSEGVVGRLGGDEFVVLLPRTDPARTEAVRAAVLAASRTVVRVADAGLRLSVGVASVAELGELADSLARDDLAEALIERADARMYDDKRAGREETVGS
jgi:diguanylate cyclase (GGDEF)-like protein